jgi:hypothetical protein
MEEKNEILKELIKHSHTMFSTINCLEIDLTDKKLNDEDRQFHIRKLLTKITILKILINKLDKFGGTDFQMSSYDYDFLLKSYFEHKFENKLKENSN